MGPPWLVAPLRLGLLRAGLLRVGLLRLGLLCVVLLVVVPSAASARGSAPATVVRPVGVVAAAQVWPVEDVAAPAAGAFRWPLPGPPLVVRHFDPPPQPWLSGHRGVDLAAAPGTLVRAAGAGTVTFAGAVAGRPVVTVTHADGLRTTYEPVRPTVEVGTPVPAGGPIGHLLAGHPGCPAASCLHWGLRRGDVYLDPLALVGRGPVRLLPLDPGAS